MVESRKPSDVQKALAERAAGPAPTGEQELVFDPKTGQLGVSSSPSPDALIATDMVNQGFF